MTDTKLTKINKRTIGLLLLATGVTCVAVFFRYLFGNEVLAFEDIGSDTSQQYLMQYASIINKIRSGDWSLWNSSYGFGANMYMLNLFNPMLVILYAIGALFGFEVLPGLMVWWFIAEILLAALCGYLYLSVFPLKESVKGAAAYMYAFNGFLIVWGQHYQFGVAVMLTPLLLWAVERLLKDKRRWPAVTLVTAVIVLNSMYIAYMILMMAAFYVVFRLLMQKKLTVGTFFAGGFRQAGAMILGLAVGAVSLLPSYAAIRNVSSRLSSDLSLLGRLSGAFHPYPADYYKTCLDRLLSGTGEGVNVFMGYLNYYEAPCLFFSGLFVILMIQYLIRLVTRKMSRRSRLLQILFILLAGAGLYFPAAGVILNGMTAPFSRYTFLYMPYFMLIAAFSLQSVLIERRVSLIGLFAAVLFMVWRYRIMILSPWHNPKKALVCVALCGLIMAGLVAALKFTRKLKVQKIVFAALCLVLAGQCAAEGYGNFSGRESLEKDDLYFETLYDADTKAALTYIQKNDDDLYRIDKLYGATYCMDALYQDYRPVSVYNSTQNRYVIDFVDNCWPELYYHDRNHYDFVLGSVRPDMAAMTGVRYILAVEPVSPAGYSLFKKFGSVTVYRQDEDASMVSYYNEDRLTEEAESGIREDSSYVNQKSALCRYQDRDRDAALTFKETGRDGLCEGSAEVAKDGLLMVMIPYEDGWEARVDGNKAPIVRTNYGFQGVYLTAGSHSVSFTYHCPLFREGAAVTLAGCLIFVLLWVITAKKGRAAR